MSFRHHSDVLIFSRSTYSDKNCLDGTRMETDRLEEVMMSFSIFLGVCILLIRSIAFQNEKYFGRQIRKTRHKCLMRVKWVMGMKYSGITRTITKHYSCNHRLIDMLDSRTQRGAYIPARRLQGIVDIDPP